MSDGLRPISIRRVVGVVAATILAAIAIYWSARTYAFSQQVAAAQTGRPVDTVVDLSRPGVIEVPFSQTCQIAHGESVLLQIADAGPKPDELLAGLRGKLEIRKASGQVITDTALPNPDRHSQEQAPEGSIELIGLAPFELGLYTLRIEIVDPAPALAGHEQRLYACYHICGLEGLIVLVSGAYAFAAGLPALLIGGFTTNGLRKHGWRSAANQNPTSAITGK